MEAFVCQVADAKNTEINAEALIQDDPIISTLSSVEMSFVGGGGLAVAFA
jgi:hypothetical protein